MEYEIFAKCCIGCVVVSGILFGAVLYYGTRNTYKYEEEETYHGMS
jgi:hypothetical protein